MSFHNGPKNGKNRQGFLFVSNDKDRLHFFGTALHGSFSILPTSKQQDNGPQVFLDLCQQLEEPLANLQEYLYRLKQECGFDSYLLKYLNLLQIQRNIIKGKITKTKIKLRQTQ